MTHAEFFSETYGEARAKYQGALERAGGKALQSYQNPAKGPDGESLWTDVGCVGPADAAKLLVLISGTHGAEGFCGSGCHTGWLAAGHAKRDLPAGTAAVFVHAINPHGFAWVRRVTEDNIDLNRNFIDHSKPPPENADYAALKDWVNPREWTPDVLARADREIAAYYGNPKEDFLPKAVHGGQYINAKGTFYGGDKPAWSNRTLREIVTQHLGRAKHICVIDYHTGGGVYGFCDLYVDDRKAGRKSRRWFEHCTAMEEMQAEHGHNQADVPGLLMYVTQQMLPKAAVTSCLVEMRTEKNRAMLRALREENWHFQHGDPNSPRGKEIRAELKERFYPSAPEWRAMVLRQSNAMIGEALAGLAEI
jgi:hypothetical protein